MISRPGADRERMAGRNMRKRFCIVRTWKPWHLFQFLRAYRRVEKSGLLVGNFAYYQKEPLILLITAIQVKFLNRNSEETVQVWSNDITVKLRFRGLGVSREKENIIPV